MSELKRYSQIKEGMVREFILLQGTGCRWKRCTFCDYHTDVSSDPYSVNREVILQVTGVYGVLDVINSGSCTELDAQTIKLISDTVIEKHIHTLWFEAHYMYRSALPKFAEQFPNVTVKFRTGAETFDPMLRSTWKKGISNDVTPQDIAKVFSGVCLLFGVKGQSFETVAEDIKIAQKYFEYFSLNAFVENGTDMQRDSELIKRVEAKCLPALRGLAGIEILLNNTDLGIG